MPNLHPDLSDAIAHWQKGERLSPSPTIVESTCLAEASGCSRREVEAALLEQGLVPERYVRNIGALGIEGQLALLKASVMIVGAGGLGGWAAEGLARLGVGRLTVIDGDAYQESNLNRQLGCTEEVLGRPKATVLVERLHHVNGAVELAAHDETLTAANAASLLSGHDVVIDALDSIRTRLLLQRTIAKLGIPLVHGAIAGWTGQVMTILPGDHGLEALYGTAPATDHGLEAQIGTPSPTPMMVSAWLVQECAKLLTGKGELLRHRLLILDALYGEVTEVAVD